MHMNENKNKRACPSDTTFSPPKTKPKRRADWRTAGLLDLQDLVKIARPYDYTLVFHKYSIYYVATTVSLQGKRNQHFEGESWKFFLLEI